MEIVEDRHEVGSTLMSIQLPIDAEHDVIGDPTFAGAILDRLFHHAFRVQLDNQNMGKTQIKIGDESTKTDPPTSGLAEAKQGWLDAPECATIMFSAVTCLYVCPMRRGVVHKVPSDRKASKKHLKRRCPSRFVKCRFADVLS